MEELSPYELRQEKSFDFGYILKTLKPKTHTLSPMPLIHQYGPSRLYDVPPGEWIDVAHLGKQDVLGSSAFTACAALIARNGDRVLFGHILSSMVDHLEGMKNVFVSQAGADAQITLVTPHWESDREGPQAWNNRYEDLAQRWREAGAEVNHEHLPYISSDSPADRWDTSILVTSNSILSIGVDYKPVHGRAYDRYDSRRSVATPKFETLRDLA